MVAVSLKKKNFFFFFFFFFFFIFFFFFFFFKQKTAYEILNGDWSSDVCSSDLEGVLKAREGSSDDIKFYYDVLDRKSVV